MPYNNKALLKDKDGIPIPQYYDPTNDTYQPIKDPTQIQLSGSNMEHYGKSTGTKPANASVPVGAKFIEIDTKNVYINDGSTWSVWVVL